MTRPPDRDMLPKTLDHGRPAPPVPASAVFAGFFGLLAALVAVAAWGMGIYCLVYALSYSLKADRAGDLSVAGVFLGIGIVCTVVAVRWIRHAYHRPSRRWGAGGH